MLSVTWASFRYYVRLSTCVFVMISKISSTYWFYNRAARVSGFVAIECCSKNSMYKFATIGETGLLIAVPNRDYWRNRTTHCRTKQRLLEKQDYSLPYQTETIGETGLLIAVPNVCWYMLFYHEIPSYHEMRNNNRSSIYRPLFTTRNQSSTTRTQMPLGISLVPLGISLVPLGISLVPLGLKYH